jgi:hypothetical protein
MIDYKIEKQGDELQIQISKIKENKERILEKFNQCKEGNCSCPTDQYTKVKDLDILNQDEKIIIKLKPRDNENFDEKEIEKCVEFTINDT